MRLEPDVDKQIKAMRQVAQYLNLGENEVNVAIDIKDDDDPQPDAIPPFQYSVDQQPQDIQSSERESEGHLSPSSSHGGSGGGGDGGNGGANEMSRGVPLEDDRRSWHSLDEQPREWTQTYRRLKRGKELVQPHGYSTDVMYGYTGFQEAPSSFIEPVSSTIMDIVQQILIALHRLTLQMSHNLLDINQGNINYEDHHYYRPPFYSGDSTSSEQSWMDSPASSISTRNKSHMVLTKLIMTSIRILPIIHFGGDKFLSIMDFRYGFVPNVQ
ncbi:hypothetical protein Cgig2_014900 [Carnegiea gigantea]|uniref:Uncharacterized protein n=1 Tax=Carnegiea gigantea TaxID=171969 RepID=A0A9Q1JKQ8_9CARY|nr:hypothetical protein Cgig2_014900 [Carnegiea gigantea]